MKKGLLIVCMAASLTVFSQHRPVGIWEGKLTVSTGLTINFIIKDSSGTLTGTMDSPDQGAYDIRIDSIGWRDDSVHITVRTARLNYYGKLINDSTIDGVFRQGIKLPLQMHKVSAIRKRGKPQTPEPPFGYMAEDVSFTNRSGDIRFAGTITYPKAGKKAERKKYPAILLISGSGAQNRDEEILGHKPFMVLADAFTKNGMAVLRVDDRGTGESTGSMASATSADLMNDAEAALDFLKSLPYVDSSGIGLAGHSEGGLIACLLAAKRKDIGFIILLAGPGVKGMELMATQNKALLVANGIPEAAADQYCVLYRKMAGDIIAAEDSAMAYDAAAKALENWLLSTDSAMVKKLGLSEKGRQSIFLKAFTKQVFQPWMKYFMNADPSVPLTELNCKVLALNGEKDVQVVAGPNLDGIRQALEKNPRQPSFTVIQLPGLNHLFQKCDKCIPGEYGKLEESFSPEAIGLINKWLDDNVKSKK